jgi:hypothetical protein
LARRFATSGLSTLLLEASQRIGGRAHTVNAAGLALDFSCGWLHSADRNPWVGTAAASRFAVERRRPAWGQQHRDLGFSPEDQDAADDAGNNAGEDEPISALPRLADRVAAHLNGSGPEAFAVGRNQGMRHAMEGPVP